MPNTNTVLVPCGIFIDLTIASRWSLITKAANNLHLLRLYLFFSSLLSRLVTRPKQIPNIKMTPMKKETKLRRKFLCGDLRTLSYKACALSIGAIWKLLFKKKKDKKKQRTAHLDSLPKHLHPILQYSLTLWLQIEILLLTGGYKTREDSPLSGRNVPAEL